MQTALEKIELAQLTGEKRSKFVSPAHQETARSALPQQILAQVIHIGAAYSTQPQAGTV